MGLGEVGRNRVNNALPVVYSTAVGVNNIRHYFASSDEIKRDSRGIPVAPVSMMDVEPSVPFARREPALRQIAKRKYNNSGSSVKQQKLSFGPMVASRRFLHQFPSFRRKSRGGSLLMYYRRRRYPRRRYIRRRSRPWRRRRFY